MTNSTIDILNTRKSIRAFDGEALSEETLETLERAAQHAASSQYLNDWSAIRVKDPTLKQQLAAIGGQSYIATAPALYVFVLDEYRNAQIARKAGIDPASDDFMLKYGYRFSQAQNDAVLALHAMETAAEALGLGCVILGSLLNDIPQLIELLGLPEYTFPVLGLAIGKPAQDPEVKPRMPRPMQFFDDRYDTDANHLDTYLQQFDDEVCHYYDLRDVSRPVETFTKQIAQKAVQPVEGKGVAQAGAQGFDLSK
ncbi:nitroreductase family protein [Bifidobacterium cuniculi]|uniref:Nitro/flavin reductase n=1 Tax=Bifidobacterium cuniculi TaxID=1688 RepID=A0A087AZF4_9BIFI|nr:nitroreductase family protein [Bifidobacterium cuniculi]KFI64154.1 Nitro/flavin reductase [Bifidobacterium cuniculi]